MPGQVNDTGMSEAWKRRRAENNGHFQSHPPPQRATSNGIRPLDPNSMGILGAGPSGKCLSGEKPFKTQPGGFPSRQEFSSGIE
ncbi:chromodomain-helicase-DNA-binding protein 2-like [Trifolium medium]|uniref:Chromodomain-helicase-DNA-binding protein 2-like n=1 Tax=Trifolium medium TaxID=97028 RepID=A0A392Q2P4_9FABA|nr:chromodomain-helicase-DNA-binding protein 2-like [Trifolium medium]